ncbi:hypothetical protein [Brevundimonas sp.]|jgi:hypothetical protein|uniref:hypothetical protein n=1 Tax=Brevundimonas sp. TaxID=1871086 RepID=UPI002E100DC5|nr:hypothetical protein [Brevundimonas sp.]
MIELISTALTFSLTAGMAATAPDPVTVYDPDCTCVRVVDFYRPTAPGGPPIRITPPGIRVVGRPVEVAGPVIHIAGPPVYVDAPPVRVRPAQIVIDRPEVIVRPSEVIIDPPEVRFGDCRDVRVGGPGGPVCVAPE